MINAAQTWDGEGRREEKASNDVLVPVLVPRAAGSDVQPGRGGEGRREDKELATIQTP
jgi:hypothetical protein